MGTDSAQQKITIAFIADRSPLLDLICKDLVTAGIEIIFKYETIDDGLSQLQALDDLPYVCIIDLDFYNKRILFKLNKLKTQYPAIKLIAHTDIDDKKVNNTLLNIGFSGYLLIGSDWIDFKNNIQNCLSLSGLS